MARSRPFRDANPDLRRCPQFPSPPIAEVERQLWQWLSPATFKPTTGERNTDGKRLRNRILTLPVMVAVIQAVAPLSHLETPKLDTNGRPFAPTWSIFFSRNLF